MFQGSPLASLNQVLKYGLRTMSGSTGGVRVDATATLANNVTTNPAAVPKTCIINGALIIELLKLWNKSFV